MSTQRLTLTGAALLIAGIFLGSGLERPATGQVVANVSPVGRFQMTTTKGTGNSTVFVLDTQTGECWYRDTNAETKAWSPMSTPVPFVRK